MAHTLKEYDAVHCTSQEQYARIIELAKKAGMPVYPGLSADDLTRYPFIAYCKDGDIEGWTDGDDLNVLPESEFIARMFGATDSHKADDRIAQLEARVAELEAKAKPASETPEEPKPYRFEPGDFDVEGFGCVGRGCLGVGNHGEYLYVWEHYCVQVIPHPNGGTALKFYRK